MEKICQRCKISKPLDSFSLSKVERDGYSHWCRSCAKQYREDNKETLRTKRRISWFNNHEVNKKKLRAYREKNKEKINEANREWQRKNVERVKEYRKQHAEHIREVYKLYRKNNPEANRIKCNRRRARLVNASGNHTVKEWENLLDKYGHKCLKCGTTENLTEDHVLPLSLGGNNSIENIQPLCSSCNSSKQDSYADYRPKEDQMSVEELIELSKRVNIHNRSRSLPGERNPKSKLTEENVIEILTSNLPTRTLAKKFSVDVSTINKIKRREIWKHVKVTTAP